MSLPIVILHGWSDDKESFRRLAGLLDEALERPVMEVWLGDYISLHDEVKMDDIVDAMARAWAESGLPKDGKQADVVIHSTGALVVRHWMDKYYTSRNDKPPVRNLVMLAPANFGSPLAHTGRSFIGRVIKGENGFQTGTQVLKALEMASPYTWNLAQRDRFAPNAFSQGGVRCTVIVGNTGYGGLRSIANKKGSDGTVYVATANLNCARLKIDVKRNSGTVKVGKLEASKGEAAFLLLDGFNHADVKGTRTDGAQLDTLLKAVGEALNVTAQSFPAWKKRCRERTDEVTNKYLKDDRNRYRHGYQNTVFHVVDDQGHEVTDYVIEFYGNFSREDDPLAEFFNEEITSEVHTYQDNGSFRSFLLDTSKLLCDIDKDGETLKISLSASPDIDDRRSVAGYRTFDDRDMGEMDVAHDQMERYFSPHRTMLVEITLPRYQAPEVFSLELLPPTEPA